MFQPPQGHHQEGRRLIKIKQYRYSKFAVSVLLRYNLPEDVIVEAETCRRDFINEKSLFIFDCENCRI